MLIIFRPSKDSIDFFANTLDIRKDAIKPYENYNPEEEEDDVSLNLGEVNNNGVIEVHRKVLYSFLVHISSILYRKQNSITSF